MMVLGKKRGITKKSLCLRSLVVRQQTFNLSAAMHDAGSTPVGGTQTSL